jgi:hypothetical protein
MDIFDELNRLGKWADAQFEIMFENAARRANSELTKRNGKEEKEETTNWKLTGF